MKLEDRVCIVTGAASGIGKEVAVRFAREGTKVVIADLGKESAQNTAEEIRGNGGSALGVAMDVSSEQQVQSAVADVVSTWLATHEGRGRRQHHLHGLGAPLQPARSVSGLQSTQARRSSTPSCVVATSEASCSARQRVACATSSVSVNCSKRRTKPPSTRCASWCPG